MEEEVNGYAVSKADLVEETREKLLTSNVVFIS